MSDLDRARRDAGAEQAEIAYLRRRVRELEAPRPGLGEIVYPTGSYVLAAPEVEKALAVRVAASVVSDVAWAAMRDGFAWRGFFGADPAHGPDRSAGVAFERRVPLDDDIPVTPGMIEAAIKLRLDAPSDDLAEHAAALYRTMRALEPRGYLNERLEKLIIGNNEKSLRIAELTRLLAISEKPGDHDYHGPTESVPHPTLEGQSIRRATPDPTHEQFHRAVGDVLAGKIIPEARRQMEDALKRPLPDAPAGASTSKPMPGKALSGFGGDPRRIGA